MPDRSTPRVAILGFSIECNKFAPPATKAHFLARTYLEGEDILAEACRPTPTMLPETPGFVAAMDAAGPWVPVGIALAMSEPNGPVEHGFFQELLDTIAQRLRGALPVDGVYICAHGAAITAEEDDPEGALFELVRGIVGPDVPVVATARGDRRAAAALAGEIAQYGWDNRARFYPKLTSLDDAVEKALAVAKDATLPALAFADVADNPGGGGRGNTMFLLRAFAAAGVKGALFGVIYDPPLAAEAHRHGLHYNFDARFNREERTKFSEPWSAPARVAALHDGNCVGRRGIYAGTRLALGPCAALAIGGITVVVVSHRVQCADPIFFEMMRLDIGMARAVVVKSRGHFRGGFDEFFGPDQIVEVDLPGLTSPMLSRFEWTRLPRPVIPLDDNVSWPPPAL